MPYVTERHAAVDDMVLDVQVMPSGEVAAIPPFAATATKRPFPKVTLDQDALGSVLAVQVMPSGDVAPTVEKTPLPP